ncbi:hypothetical protein A8709_09295 [Paenibacillus pectinilyticus]|uniref:PPM-type phosphatase domain-containing protein n=1 Tax=Paenibacillus pectinilyticus TaxID=512399 RepID=A0A1C1A5H6_9BACL|nr:hypothetical protein A8709_09295 [Paenibacillus pectinilyticus]
MGGCVKASWKYAFASVKGTSHEKNGLPCQDASLCEILKDKNGQDILVAVVSDGAGSAPLSDQGSKLICALFMDEMKALLATGQGTEDVTETFFKTWLNYFQKEIKVRAEISSGTPRDFACTFLCAIISNECEIFAQIGDGAIVVSNELDHYLWVFWPHQGEYENTTFFATDVKAEEWLQYERRKGVPCFEVALFSDGLQRLALHYQTQSAHSPFFRPFFSALRSQEQSVSDKYTQSLISFLGSPPVNERTDDDKTFILATRRGD